MDIKLDASHDLSNPLRQDSLREQLGQVDFIAAAFDCSTKSRAREIPRPFQDGRPAPKPLRSEALPEGLAGLSKKDQARVDQDNKACAFVLRAIQDAAERGAGAVRENPANNCIGFCPRRSNPSSRGCGGTPTVMPVAGEGRGIRGSACATTSMRSPPGRLCSATIYTAKLSGSRSSTARSVGTLPRRRQSTQQRWHSRSRSPCLGGLPGSAKPSLLSPVCLCQAVWGAGKHGSLSTRDYCGNGP